MFTFAFFYVCLKLNLLQQGWCWMPCGQQGKKPCDGSFKPPADRWEIRLQDQKVRPILLASSSRSRKTFSACDFGKHGGDVGCWGKCGYLCCKRMDFFFFLLPPASLTAGMVMCKAVPVSLWSPCTAEGWPRIILPPVFWKQTKNPKPQFPWNQRSKSLCYLGKCDLMGPHPFWQKGVALLISASHCVGQIRYFQPCQAFCSSEGKPWALLSSSCGEKICLGE